MGSYFLVVRNAPQFGIRGGLNSVLSMPSDEQLAAESLNRKLDADDPIDRAILNALKDRAAEMRDAVSVPMVKDRRMGPRETHEIAQFGRRTVFGKR
ncbi:MAG: hypothetical protein U5K75_04710 [Ahrensia sp.]|nr:hypothetical protein [Ahrensia sp.]